MFEQHGGASIERVIAPCGTGGLIVALGKGFAEIAASVPSVQGHAAIDCVQLAALMPMSGHRDAFPARPITTAAAGVGIANPSMRDNVVRIVEESGGMIRLVSEEEAPRGTVRARRVEGVGAEPPRA